MDLRQHYKCVGEKGLSKKRAEEIWDKITVDEIIKYKDDDDLLSSESICLKKFSINHGLKNDHPLNKVKFYNIKRIEEGCFKLNDRTL